MRQRGRAWLWLLAVFASGTVGWWYFAPHTLPTTLRHAAPVSPNAHSTSPPLYKWRDAENRLHITDVPPKDRPYQTVHYDPNTNVVPAYGTTPKSD